MSNWPEPHDAFLRQKREEGLSSSQIAVALWDQFHVSYSRNAVIGRAHRLGLTKPVDVKPKVFVGTQKKPRKPASDRNKQPVIKTKTLKFGGWAHSGESLEPDVTPLRAADIVPKHLTLFDLNETTCRWPYGGWPSEAPITFCGHPPSEKSPYCDAHARLSLGRGTAGEREAILAPKCEAA